MTTGREWAPSPYQVECMGFEMFQQARWLAVYGAFIAAQTQAQISEGRGAPG